MRKELNEEDAKNALNKYRQELISSLDTDIKELIENIKRKLNIQESIEDIVDRWDDKDPWLLGFWLSHICDECDEELDVIYEELNNDFYDEYHNLPWEDVLASICMMPQKVKVIDAKCPHCGENIIASQFMSKNRSWEYMCGCAGVLAICPNSLKQLSFVTTVCN